MRVYLALDFTDGRGVSAERMPRGRPKKFEEQEALTNAMLVFWRKGYEATSLDDLTREMGIPRQSLYRFFGDKHTLFLRALEHYDQHVTSVIVDALEADQPAIDNLFTVFALWKKTVNSPEQMGCMMVNTCTQIEVNDEDVAKLVRANQARAVDAFKKTLKRAQSEGDVPGSIDITAASRAICAAVNGLLAMSRAGLSQTFKRDVLASLPVIIGVTRKN